jgi:cation diffusion facilitator CzcD-associated flavoprotein CzcO
MRMGRTRHLRTTRTAHRLFGPAGTPEVVIVGAGFGGIAAGVKLVRAGIDTFTIFEKSEGPGGTWWDNRYPGCEVDVWSHLYSYSFKSHDWTRTHARQEELQRYLEEVVDEFDLRRHIRFGTTVEEATWDEHTHRYTIRLLGGETLQADVLVSALGLLNYPRYPDWPGLEDFEGPKFHTFRWEHQHDLTGKRVAVVGTGSTATQVVPELAPIVGHLYLFQREPGWVIPKGERDFTPEERARFRSKLQRRRERLRMAILLERNQLRGAIHRPGTKVNRSREQMCRDFIDRVFADRPDLRQAVTPTYPYPGKRPILNSTFYPALKLPNVELVPKAVTSVTRQGVVDADGREHPVDVLIMATGFEPANYLASLEVTGRGGRTIHELWAGEPQAFLGITVPEFPNFYMLYGPNTNGGEIVSNLERQAEYVRRAVKRMVREGVTAVEVRPFFSTVYNWWLQRKMAGTAWLVSNNYYKSSSGRIVTQWPFGFVFYGVLTKILGRVSETTRVSPRRRAGWTAPATTGATTSTSPAPAEEAAETVPVTGRSR